ncbi:MAG: hypothetical protein JXL84_04910 [Deltaproteobacteria bacterium]|nr:hypothetical protein [Deltaproteobacteria bacterium]
MNKKWEARLIEELKQRGVDVYDSNSVKQYVAKLQGISIEALEADLQKAMARLMIDAQKEFVCENCDSERFVMQLHGDTIGEVEIDKHGNETGDLEWDPDIQWGDLLDYSCAECDGEAIDGNLAISRLLVEALAQAERKWKG